MFPPIASGNIRRDLRPRLSDISAMSLKANVESRLEELGINPYEAARRGGLERNFVQDILHERKRTVRGDNLNKLAKALACEPADLIPSAGSRRSGPEYREVIGYAGADPEGTVLFAHGQGTGDYAPVPPNGSPTARAIEIRGHSMPFFAEDGTLVWFDDQKTKPDPEMIGHVVVVQLDTDEVLIKRLLRGSDRGLFDLESIAGPTRRDVRPVWVARIISIIPPLEARRIIQRGGLAA